MKNANRKITKSEWGRFLADFRIARYKALGERKFDAEFDHWEWEESEDIHGSYFVTYYAMDADDAQRFSDAVKEVAEKRGWAFEGVEDRGGFDENGFGPEKSGPHKGRTLIDVFVTRGENGKEER